MKTRLVLFFLSGSAVYLGFQILSFLWVAFGLGLFLLAARRSKKPGFTLEV